MTKGQPERLVEAFPVLLSVAIVFSLFNGTRAKDWRKKRTPDCVVSEFYHYLCNGIEMMNIRSVINAIEEFAPRTLQESYDNSGLQAGDVANDCKGALLTLDVTERTIKEAEECGFNLIISHHPLLFKGIKSLTPTTATGKILTEAIRKDIAIYSAHTSLDNARYGVSCRMAEKLGLCDIQVLRPQTGTMAKIVVFVPGSHTDAIKTAMSNAGAGHIGDYDSCAYQMAGTGSYRPLEGAKPYAGTVGKLHHEPEMRIEMIARSSQTADIIDAMLKAHPYEEPAFDIITLANANRYAGSGAIGKITPTDAESLLKKLKTTFGCPCVRYCGNKSATIRRIALCGGSGAFLIGDAIAAGADIYISGDIKYHDFTEAAGKIIVADIGHYESEQCAKEIIRDILTKRFPTLPVAFAKNDENTINYI